MVPILLGQVMETTCISRAQLNRWVPLHLMTKTGPVPKMFEETQDNRPCVKHTVLAALQLQKTKKQL
jgi:hypothetical protein